MSEKLIISSSSFLLPNHPAWNLLGEKFDLNFKYIGNFSSAFLSKNDDEIIVSILFFPDLYDENLPNDVDENKINDPIIELVKRKTEKSKKPIIFALSSWSSFNIINSVFQKPLSEKIFLDFTSKLSLLQKTHPNVYFFNLD